MPRSSRFRKRCGVSLSCDVNGLSTAHTAEALGLSEEAVKSRLLRTRLAWRERLAAYMSGRVPHAEMR